MSALAASVPYQLARTIAHVPGGHVKYGASTLVSSMTLDHSLS
jgi:hypothetical protein